MALRARLTRMPHEWRRKLPNGWVCAAYLTDFKRAKFILRKKPCLLNFELLLTVLAAGITGCLTDNEHILCTLRKVTF